MEIGNTLLDVGGLMINGTKWIANLVVMDKTNN
jgi:hypothetical protein